LTEDSVGSVWKAQDTVLGRIVAVKILRPEVTADTEQRDFITSEARAASHLDHPAIAKIYELDRVGDDLFIVLEHVEGEPLNRLVRGKPLSREWFLRIAEPLTEAIHEAHAADVIHGNLHGWDVLVAEDGRVRVVGFGTGRASSSGGPVQDEVDSAEQAYYFSPERVVGRNLQATSDIFSLGAIFYEMATGRVPFPGSTPAEVCERIVNAAPPAPQLYTKSIDAGIVDLIGRCILKDPSRRFQTAGHLLTELRRIERPQRAAAASSRVLFPPGEGEAPAGSMPLASRPVADSAERAAGLGPEPLRAPASRLVDEAGTPGAGLASAGVRGSPAEPIAPSAMAAALGNALALLGDTSIGEEQPAAPEEARDYETVGTVDRQSVIFFASMPPLTGNPEESGIERLPGVMQQILGEAVYLYNGRIVDPFGSRMIAEFEDAQSAVRAASKGKEDLEAYNAGQFKRALQIPARLIVHCGEARTAQGALVGQAVESAQSAALELPPLTVAVSGPLLKLLGIEPPGQPIATTDVEFYSLPKEDEIREAEPEESTLVSPPEPPKPKRPGTLVAVAAGFLLMLAVILGIAFVFGAKRKSAALDVAQQKLAAAANKKVARALPGERQIAIEPFWVLVADPSPAAPSAETIRLSVIGILDLHDGLRVVDAPAGADKFSATIRQGISGIEFVPTQIAPEALQGAPVPLTDSAQATRALAAWISERLQVVPTSFAQTSPETLEIFARAVAERRSGGGMISPQLADLSKSLAKADSNFVPGQLLALDTFERLRDDNTALLAARAVLALDPRNVEVRKRLAAIRGRLGQPGAALADFVEVLREQPDDRDSLNAVAVYALAVNDRVIFDKMRTRLEEVGAPRRLHGPDVLLVEGQIDRAASPLFELEAAEPDNADLALKIGRVAVLRRMMSIADIELRKLRSLDPGYGYPMLNAYVLAERRDSAGAVAEMQRATARARWDDLPFTRAAEIYAILGDSKGVIESLESAVAHGEPSGTYILNHPMFRYLGNDRRFRRLRERMERQMNEIRAALLTVPI
jgi:tetratricopeptide (TPR) repeat protein